jgi:hypothetical protein
VQWSLLIVQFVCLEAFDSFLSAIHVQFVSLNNFYNNNFRVNKMCDLILHKELALLEV